MRLMTTSGVLGSMVGMALLTGCSTLGTTIAPGEVGLKYLILKEPGLQEQPYPEGFYFQWA